MSTTEQRRHVVLLGAGYLSIWSYRALKRKVGKQVDFTVVAPATAHTFHGWTGEVLSGELPPDAQLSPISEAMPTARHVRGHARSVDRAARTVEVERVDGTKQTLHYDHLIVGTGQYEDVSRVEGMEEHAYRLRDAGRTGKLVAHLDECVESARSSTEEKLRAKALTVVVAGGGLAGIEASVAIAQRLARATEGTPEREYAEVVLVTPTGELAKEMPPKLRAHVRKEIQDNGVRLIAPARVVAVGSDGVKLDDGSWLAASTVVAAIGNSPRPLPGLDDLPVDDRGAVRADRMLQIAPEVWSGGDAASVPLASGEPCPVDAAWAIGQGSWVGGNVARVIQGRAQREFTWKSVGVTAGFGRGHAVLEAWGMSFRGRPAWLSRAAFFGYYLPSRPQLRRVLRMLVARRRGK
ncbi:hypothetical protein CFP71_22275 [Amycolatopsis thailandensis]|uniref:FAD/NAD(P)-binding domain-containing protein n=1 Tax=Amycolatopsis thailandensis TaxID=589330 RepID=A0A229S2Z2_9PSEU|nr:FAD-dependent oxidoreductase [Amycolatopsis thailandensis]OXM53246.1 hypothetical protein CFP71_22275 [Amycolatopsis thailandensis]